MSYLNSNSNITCSLFVKNHQESVLHSSTYFSGNEYSTEIKICYSNFLGNSGNYAIVRTENITGYVFKCNFLENKPVYTILHSYSGNVTAEYCYYDEYIGDTKITTNNAPKLLQLCIIPPETDKVDYTEMHLVPIFIIVIMD